MLDAAHSIPGVQSVTIGVVGPVTGAARTSSVVIEGYSPQADEDLAIHQDFVGPDYFSTLGMRIVAGRDFNEHDNAKSPQVADINQTMARRYFGETSPIGRRFGYGNVDEIQVIGVVADARSNGLRRDPPAFAYFPLEQRSQEYARNLYVRTSGNVEPVFFALKEAMKTAAPGIAVREVVTLGELAERSVYAERLVSRLTAVFALLGVAVACLGLYGTIAYSVARRTNEIGVRLALGASPSGVRRMVLAETFTLLTLGVIGGLGLVLALGGLASTQLYGLSPRDPVTLSLTAAVVIAVGLVAGAIPSWRASRVSPTIALRQDG
jgi:predicted permease